MASVRLSSREATRGELPRVCMRCGARARVEVERGFTWHPQWVYLLLLLGILPCVIVALILTKRRTVQVPLCEAHQGYWSWRAWFTGLGLLFLVLLGVAGLVLAVNLDPRGNSPLGGLVCLATAAGFLFYLLALAIIHQVSIRPTEITDTGITLTNVSPEFVEALEDERTLVDTEREREYRQRRGRD